MSDSGILHSDRPAGNMAISALVIFILGVGVQFHLAAAGSGGSGKSQYDKMVRLEGGTYRIGTDAKDARDGEGPSRMVKVSR